ncbi:hypothetical protein PRZ48_006127 [Zasmidium cellare]|uniref:WW domain-containing protein n=1 Tax=Zasmidium cellare TaxID=395010 RepID=A0ABR0ENH5_ZASCE|nr:hypothetical protein PRZ48_006127 [Zasmidium cellare]
MPTSRAPPQWRQDSAGRWFYYRPENDTLVYQTGQVLSRPSNVPRSMLLASSQDATGQQTAAQQPHSTTPNQRGREVARVEESDEEENEDDDDDDEDEDEDEDTDPDDGQHSSSYKGKQPVRAAASQADRRGTSSSSGTHDMAEQMQRLQMGSMDSSSNYVLSSQRPTGQVRTALAAAATSSKAAILGDDYTTFVADIAGKSFQGKYDTGADGNFVSMDVIRQLGLHDRLKSIPRTSENTFYGMGEKPIVPKYRIHLTWRDNKGNEYREPCYVVEHSPYDLLIGSELIRSERILVPNERRSALPLKRDPKRVKEDKNLARREQANEARALREVQLAESSRSRAQPQSTAAGGQTLNIEGQMQIIPFEQLRWAQYYGEAWRRYIGTSISPSEAMTRLVDMFMGSNPNWSRDQAYQYLSRMIEIARAAGYI